MSQDESAKQPATAEDMPMEDMPELVIVSGMSGAGRTEAMHVFEDLGYFCVDNRDSSPEALVFNRSVKLKDSFKPGK